MVGYGEGNNYHVWLPQTNRVIKSTYIKFDETPRSVAIPYSGETQPDMDPDDLEEYVDIQIPTDNDTLSTVVPSTNILRQLPLILPPLGQHTMEELVVDLDATLEPIGHFHLDVRGSTRATKGRAPS